MQEFKAAQQDGVEGFGGRGGSREWWVSRKWAMGIGLKSERVDG